MRNRIWLSLGAILILSGLTLAAFTSARWYITQEIRSKLTKMADWAGLEVSIGGITVNLNGPIQVHRLAFNTPNRSKPMLTIETIDTQLTMKQLVMGARRPSRIHVSAPHLDLTFPSDWENAVNKYRAGRNPSTTRKNSTLPVLTWSQGTARFRIPHAQKEIHLHSLDGQIQATTTTPRLLQLSISGLDNNNRHFKSSGQLSPVTREFELGASFVPAVSLSTDLGVTVEFSGIYLKQFHTLRLNDLKIQQGNKRIEAAHFEVKGAADGVLWASPLRGTFRNLLATNSDLTTRAGRATIQLAAINLEDPIAAFRTVTLEHLSFESTSALVALAAESSTVTGNGRKIEEIALSKADVSFVLPSLDRAKGIPYYRRIQAFILGHDASETPRGGGPKEPAPPNTTIKSQLEQLPKVKIQDGSLALLAGPKTETVMLVHALNAELPPVGDTLDLAISGRLHELATGDQGRFNVVARAKSDGRLESATIKLSGTKLAAQLAQLSDKIRITERSSLTVDLDLKPHADGKGITLAGSVGMKDVGFYAPRVHGTLVDGLSLQADLTADLSLANDTLTLDMPRIVVNDKAIFRMMASVERLDGRLPKLDVKLKMPAQSCQGLVDSIPAAMAPRIQGMILDGSFDAFVNFTVDLIQPRSFKWKIAVNMDQCKARSTGMVDIERLKTNFVHEVVEKGIPTGVMVGPGTHHYRPLARIPKHIQMGAIWTEDHSFFKHAGFRTALIRRAIVLDLEKERYIYGGSTISQQLVKNLFLSREKTLSRKLEEAIIVWAMERSLTKKRILELYLNCIEYGPKLYGIDNAARAYFGKPVDSITPLEGAFLMGLKPYPWAGWKQLQRGFVQPWWHKRLSKILEGMNKRGWISDEELALSQPYEPIFVTSPHSAPSPRQLQQPRTPIFP
ncbi:MAG TPA: hypothetical protein EYN06_08025 [Myxococcales bacterium]|nr:hypothetical protein [Myxococcales bacterium]